VEEPAVLLIREDAALLDAMTAELLAGRPVRGNA
jgi:hypothetical protein